MSEVENIINSTEMEVKKEIMYFSKKSEMTAAATGLLQDRNLEMYRTALACDCMAPANRRRGILLINNDTNKVEYRLARCKECSGVVEDDEEIVEKKSGKEQEPKRNITINLDSLIGSINVSAQPSSEGSHQFHLADDFQDKISKSLVEVLSRVVQEADKL